MTFETPMFQGERKPGKVQAIGILTLISGISNILWMLFLGLFAVTPLAVVTLGIGCLLYPLLLLPIVLGVFEIIFAAKLLPTPIKPAKPSMAIAWLEIVCILTGNLLAAAAGIVALIFYGEAEVKAYFAKFSPQGAAKQPEAAPVVPPAPVTAQPVSTPVPAEPEAPVPFADAIVPAAIAPAATVASMQPVTVPIVEPEEPEPAAPAPVTTEPVQAAQPKAARKPAAKAPAKKTAAKATGARPAAKPKTGKPAPAASKPKPAKPARTSKPAASKAGK